MPFVLFHGRGKYTRFALGSLIFSLLLYACNYDRTIFQLLALCSEYNNHAILKQEMDDSGLTRAFSMDDTVEVSCPGCPLMLPGNGAEPNICKSSCFIKALHLAFQIVHVDFLIWAGVSEVLLPFAEEAPSVHGGNALIFIHHPVSAVLKEHRVRVCLQGLQSEVQINENSHKLPNSSKSKILYCCQSNNNITWSLQIQRTLK